MQARRWHLLRRGAIGALVLVVILLSGYREATQLYAELPLLTLFPDAVAQARAQQGSELYDALSAAGAVLPRDAGVLLVTAGTDPRHDEYVAFHRALYALAPRPVWWANPAVPDGTWESRWWIPTPLSAERLGALAAERDADYILFYRTTAPAEFRTLISLTPRSTLAARTGDARFAPIADTFSRQGSSYGGVFAGILLLFAVGAVALAVVRWFDGARPGAADESPLRAGSITTSLEGMGLAWACGAGCVTILLFWLNGAGLDLGAQVIVLSAFALIASGVVTFRARNHVRSAPYALTRVAARTRLNLPEILLAVWIGLQVAYVAVLALGRPLDVWDSWVTYALKARTIWLENQLTSNVYADASRAVTHPEYPLLVPLVEAWTFHWAGTPDDRLAGIPAVLFFVTLLAVAFAGLRHFGAGRMSALGIVAVLASLPAVNGNSSGVMADVPLAVYALIAALHLAKWREMRSRGALLVGVLAAGLMPWTKREGIVLLGALLVIWIATGLHERATWVAVVACLAAALVLAGPWWLLMAREGGTSADMGPVTWAALAANGMRLPIILYHEARHLLGVDWLPAWLLVPALVSVRRGGFAVRVFLPGAALLYLGALSAAYIFSDFAPYQQHVVSSIDRLAVHVAPLVLVWRPAT